MEIAKSVRNSVVSTNEVIEDLDEAERINKVDEEEILFEG